MKIRITKRKKIAAVVILLLLLFYWFSLPKNLFENPTSTVVLSSEGRLMGARIATDGQWRFPQMDSVPEKFKKCIVAFEDRYFYYHPGVNLVSLGRAAYQDVKAGKIVSGGSTLTMQVARLSSGHKSRNLWYKVLEMIRATRIEISYSKDEILNLYASNAPFGGNVVGLNAAAWRFYHRSAFQLSWAETATLAVLPNAPSLIHPGKNRKLLLEKRNRLLKKLLEQKVIDKMTYGLALNEKLPDRVFPLPNIAPHLTERINMNKKGEIITTTLDYRLQNKINKILNGYAKNLLINSVNNAAILVLDVETGHVLAYLGNTKSQHDNDETGSHYVDIITASRSSGSTLKPFLYAGLFDDGKLMPRMLVPDIPTQIAGYHPENFHRNYDGLVPASEALARSLNIPAVRLLRDYGIQKFLGLLHKVGLSTVDRSADNYGLTLILGGAEVNLQQLTGAYASMARVLNNYYKKGYDKSDWHYPIYEKGERKASNNDHTKILSASAIYEAFNALLDANRPINETGWKLYSCSERIAWKTGTSYGFRDAWSVGVTPKYVVGVWVGNADGEGRPGMTGLAAAAPIMFDVFNVLPDTTWFAKPKDEMVVQNICDKSGYRAGPYCQETHNEYVTKKSETSPICPYHKLLHLDKNMKYQVNSSCEDVSHMIHKSWFVLPPVYEYYFKIKNPYYVSPPPLRDDCRGDADKVMQFIYPPPAGNAKVFIPKDFTGKQSAVVFKVSHRNPSTKLFWHLDNVYIGSTENIHEMALNPPKGKHIITVIDGNGITISKYFEVVSEKSY